MKNRRHRGRFVSATVDETLTTGWAFQISPSFGCSYYALSKPGFGQTKYDGRLFLDFSLDIGTPGRHRHWNVRFIGPRCLNVHQATMV